MIDNDRALLFEDSDPGVPGTSWWTTPGGGVDDGESETNAAIREVAEETGYRLTESELLGPIAKRHVVHGYSDLVIEQDESFFLAMVSPFEIDISAHTTDERLTLLGHRWWTHDARFNVPRIGRVPIGRGRDAVDVAMVTTYGIARLERMVVWSDPVGEPSEPAAVEQHGR